MTESRNCPVVTDIVIRATLDQVTLPRYPITDHLIIHQVFPRLEEISGVFFLSCGDAVLTRSVDGSSDYITDAVVSLMIGLHDIISQLFDTSISSIVYNECGVKFYYHRTVLLISGGKPPGDILTSEISLFSSDTHSIPVFYSGISRIDFAKAVQVATENLISQILALDTEMENHHSVKKLRACCQKTEQILDEFQKKSK